MDSLIPVVMILIGAILGASLTWLVTRAKARRSYVDGQADSKTEIATLAERVAAKNRELEEFRSTIEGTNRKKQELSEEIREEAEK